jgi:exodeoxyribonuclease-3
MTAASIAFLRSGCRERLVTTCEAVKIASWNINSIRARQQRMIAYLDSAHPDVLCLQELKCTDAEFPALDIRAAGYSSVCYGQKSYNGVAIISRLEPEEVVRGLGDDDGEGGARLISARIGDLSVISVYAPNGQAVDSPAFQSKLLWYERLRRYLDAHYSPDQPLVLCGDFNVAPEARDVYDPVIWSGQTMFTEKERAALNRVREFGLVDTFRLHHPDEGRFSWWDYRMLAFAKNRGLRIDHLYATRFLAEKCVAADIDREARKGSLPSDHAPVWAEFALDPHT